jgi:ABC-2 type transport system permease protein
MSDLTTVVWKEWRELRAQSADFGGTSMIVTVTVLLVLVGGMAAIAGPELLRTPFIVVISATPLFAVIGTICEAFAGERERHTLETLLASRVTTEALLVGKIVVNVLYAWGGAVLLFVLLVVGANVPALDRSIVFPPIGETLFIFVIIPLLLLLVCTAGVLVSLRAPTVRHAQSKLVLFFMGTAFLFLIPFLIIRSVFPHLMEAAKKAQAGPNFVFLAFASWGVILLAIDVVLLLVARLRFQREQMIVTAG